MPNGTQLAAQRLGGSLGARAALAQALSLTMSAGATASGAVSVPEGSWLTSIRAETGAAFTGGPTNINLRCGTAAAGQQVVADVDVKAQGHLAATIVAGFDAVAGTATYWFQISAVGGTNPAGAVTVIVSYQPPVK